MRWPGGHFPFLQLLAGRVVEKKGGGPDPLDPPLDPPLYIMLHTKDTYEDSRTQVNNSVGFIGKIAVTLGLLQCSSLSPYLPIPTSNNNSIGVCCL